LASLASGVGLGLGIGVGYSTVGELARYALLLAKWNIIPEEMKRDILAQTLQSILEAEKSNVTGLTTSGMVDVLYDFIDKTLWLSLYTSESISTQMFIQMIQQSIAYAIQHSHAGAIGTVGNVYSGSMYLSPMFASTIGENIENVNREQRAFLGASTGLNIPTLSFELTRGVNQRLRDILQRLVRDIEMFTDEWNDLALTYYRQHHTLCREALNNAVTMKEDVVQRAYSVLEDVCRTHLSRVTENLDTLEGAKAWYDAGLISDEELGDIAMRIKLETEASKSDYESMKQDVLDSIQNALTEWDNKISQALQDLTENEKLIHGFIRNMLSKIFYDVEKLVDEMSMMVERMVEDACAYRNISRNVEHRRVGMVVETEERTEELLSYSYETEVTVTAVSKRNVLANYMLTTE